MGRMKSIAELERQQEHIAAQIQAAKARQRKRARTQRNHALMVYGGIVEEVLGDWYTLDPAKLRSVLLGNQEKLSKVIQGKYSPDTDQFNKALRQWEREQAAWRKAGKSYEPRGFGEIVEEVIYSADTTAE